MEKAFDKGQLKQIDLATKKMAQARYDLCLYKCDMENDNNNAACKQSCFNKILVPFHMIKH